MLASLDRFLESLMVMILQQVKHWFLALSEQYSTSLCEIHSRFFS